MFNIIFWEVLDHEVVVVVVVGFNQAPTPSLLKSKLPPVRPEMILNVVIPVTSYINQSGRAVA